MKCKHFVFRFVICCLFLVSCKNKPDNTQNLTTINFHDYIEKPLSEIPEDFYSDKRYVVLHADEQRMMLKNLTHIALHNDKIYAADSYNRNFVVHDMNGHAIAKVGNRGRGAGEYLNVTCFDVDDQGQIHLIDGNADRLLIYDADYKFVEAKELPFEVDIIKCMPDGGYLMGLSSWDSSPYGGTRITRTTRDLTVVNEVGQFDKKLTDDNVQFSDYYFIETPEGIFYHRSPEETVYLLDEEGNIQETYYYDLGQDAIPIKDRGNLMPLMDSEEIASYKALMNFAVPHGGYIFGSMYDKNVFTSYLYDSDNHIIYTKNNETADDFGNILMIDNGYLITLFPYLDGEYFPDDLSEEMCQQVIDGDLLICLYKIK